MTAFHWLLLAAGLQSLALISAFWSLWRSAELVRAFERRIEALEEWRMEAKP